jgi:molybdopterin molybdotransferase
MVSVEEALRIIKMHMPQWGNESAALDENILADRDYPPFNRVMMDGIALSSALYREGKRSFKISGIVPAGAPQAILEDVTSCVEIMTGAPLPVGAHFVIPYEHLRIEDHIATITIEMDRPDMDNVHVKGSDCKKGDVLLHAGAGMNGPHWGIAASVGHMNLKAKRQPKILVISTGDELVPVSSTPLDHQIRTSNSYAIAASLKMFGHTDVEIAHLPDDVATIRDHYQSASKENDILIYSGGVSKGKFDHLPDVWKSSGVDEHFHGVTQRPGKPLWFGVDHQAKTAVLGLPGNPVSSLVCLHKYFLSGKKIYAQLTSSIIFKKDLTYFVPVKISFDPLGILMATPLPMKNSGEFSALAGSDGFVELPKDKNEFKSGESFLFHPWRPW